MNMTRKNTEGKLTSMLVAVETAPNQLAFEQEIENTKL